MNRIGRAVAAAAGLLLALAGVAFVLYQQDYGLEATVVAKRCDPPAGAGFFGGGADPRTSTVTVKTRLLGIRHDAGGLTFQLCSSLHAGNFVVYHVRSGRTILYESEGGACLYDSVGGAAGCP